MKELARRESQAVQRPEPNPANTYEMFLALAKDPSVPLERLNMLMDMQIKAETRNAEKEFNAAFARLVPSLPRIVKRGEIPKGGGTVIKFCTIEDMDAIIRPLYTAEGFTLSFYSKPTTEGIIRVGKLRHVAGHSELSEMQLPPDKGPGRNSLQELGSAISYADRYITKGMFNIITVGEDKDGASFGLKAITQQQADDLDRRMVALDFDEKKRSAFFTFMGIKGLSDIRSVQLPQASNYLGLMERKK